MNRIIRNFVSTCIIAALTISVFVSCGNQGNFIMVPEDAHVAVKFDFSSIWNKAVDTESEEFKNLKSEVEMMIDSFSASVEETELILDIIDDPNVSGADVNKPVYLSVVMDDDVSSENGEVFLSFHLCDRVKFTALIDDLCAEESVNKSTLQGGHDVYAFEDGLYLAVSDGSAVLYTFIEDELTGGMERMETLMQQKSGPEDEGFTRFINDKSDCAMWMSVEAAIDMALDYSDIDEELMSVIISDPELFSGASSLTTLDFQDGKIVLKATSYGSDEYLDSAQRYVGMASDKYFSKLPYSTTVVFNAALKDLNKVIEEMKRDEELAEAVDQLATLGFTDLFFEGLPGVITVGVDLSGDDDAVGFVAVAECDKVVYQKLQMYLPLLGAEKEGDAYKIDKFGYISYVDGALVVMDSALWALSDNGKGFPDSFMNNPLSSDLRQGGISINLQQLHLDSLLDEDYVEQAVNYVENIVLTAEDNGCELVVRLTDDERNILETLVDLAYTELL